MGWHAMRKDQLIRALSVPPATAKKSAAKAAAVKAWRRLSRHRAVLFLSAAESSDARLTVAGAGDVASRTGSSPLLETPTGCISTGSFPVRPWRGAGRARSGVAHGTAALAFDGRDQRGHDRASERQIRDIEIHGGVNNWFIDVQSPPRSYRIDIGYLARRGKFFVSAFKRCHHSESGDHGYLRRGLVERAGAVPAALSPVGGANGSADSHDLRDLRGAIPPSRCTASRFRPWEPGR